MDLFEHAADNTDESSKSGEAKAPLGGAGPPLAERLRPRTLDEILGQGKILGGQAAWKRLLESGRLPSMILWGPPGCGKTTFALLVAAKADAEVINENATDLPVKRLRELGEAGRRRRLEFRKKTLLFIDEIHRLNKGQQDILLPFIEKGDLTLIGATTENPSYELNSALLSRCRILVFSRLDEADLARLLDRGFAALGANPTDLLTADAQTELVRMADGDGRRLLNMVESIAGLYAAVTGPLNAGPETAANPDSGETDAAPVWPLQADRLDDLLAGAGIRYDKTADEHYDTVSAFIKSVRGSNPDAAVYYLARMIKGGEDPVFIARRLVILASEDIGNADPRALSVAIAGLQAVELVGWPEGAISLAQVTTYLASAPKSNRSYMALRKAQAVVEQTGTLPIPLSLRSASTKAMKDLGYGRDYRYSHEGPKGYIEQDFLPQEIKGETFYEPLDRGFEKTIRQYLEWLKS